MEGGLPKKGDNQEQRALVQAQNAGQLLKSLGPLHPSLLLSLTLCSVTDNHCRYFPFKPLTSLKVQILWTGLPQVSVEGIYQTL